jgi:hypothetical protein
MTRGRGIYDDETGNQEEPSTPKDDATDENTPDVDEKSGGEPTA